MAEWLKTQDFDASASAVVRAPVRAATLCPYTYNGVRVCGRNCTEAREREWAEGTVSSLPGTLNVRIKFCHSSGNCAIGVVGSVPAQQAMLREGSDPANPPKQNIRTKFIKKTTPLFLLLAYMRCMLIVLERRRCRLYTSA